MQVDICTAFQNRYFKCLEKQLGCVYDVESLVLTLDVIVGFATDDYRVLAQMSRALSSCCVQGLMLRLKPALKPTKPNISLRQKKMSPVILQVISNDF